MRNILETTHQMMYDSRFWEAEMKTALQFLTRDASKPKSIRQAKSEEDYQLEKDLIEIANDAIFYMSSIAKLEEKLSDRVTFLEFKPIERQFMFGSDGNIISEKTSEVKEFPHEW